MLGLEDNRNLIARMLGDHDVLVKLNPPWDWLMFIACMGCAASPNGPKPGKHISITVTLNLLRE